MKTRLPHFVLRNLRYRFVALSVPIALGIGAALLILFWMMTQSIVDELGARISTDQVLLDRARAELPLSREFTLAEALAGEPALIRWARNPNDETARTKGLAELERFRVMFKDRNFFFVPDATRAFHFMSPNEPADTPLVKYTLAKDNPDDAWYFSTIALSRVCYINIDFDRELRNTKVWFNCNVRDPDTDDVLGIVGTGIDLTAFIDNLQIRQPDAVTAIYVDEQGAIQAHPNVDLIEHDALTKPDNLKSTIFDLLDDPAERQQLKDALAKARTDPEMAASLSVDIDGETQFVGITFIPLIKWFSISVMDLKTLVFGHFFVPLAVLVAIAVVASLTALGIAIDRTVLRRIDGLDRSVNAFRDDNTVEPSAAPSADPPDQIDSLRQHFDEMAKAVRADTIELSDLVAARTQELQRSNDELMTVNQQKDKFFAIIAHDLISPFNTLIGVSGYMKNQIGDLSHEKIEEYTADLNDAAVNMHRLLENLLAWGRLQQGEVRFAPEITDIGNLIRESAAILQPIAAHKSVRLVLDLAPDHTAVIDPRMVDTIARNLIINAVKFSHPGGQVTITTASENGNTVLRVTDRGIGMDSALLEDIRTFGTKSTQKGTAGETGTGLGLQLCLEMIDLHGGRLDIQSAPGEGSTFTVFLPDPPSPE